ncbi:N-acetyltransferase family protein [Pseudonocardia saturnea]
MVTALPARVLALRSGGQVWVRPIEPADGPELRRAFEHLSAQSRYRRFFTGMPTLSDALVRRLTEVDHVDEEALVAVPDEGSPTIVGVARFVRDRHDPATADLAITVADEWHGRGLGSGLLCLLSHRACDVGIRHFTTDMLAENRAVLALVRSAGGVPTGDAGSVVTSRIDLADEPEAVPCDAAAVLRAAARGEVLSLPRLLRELVPDARCIARAVLQPATTTLSGPRPQGGPGATGTTHGTDA